MNFFLYIAIFAVAVFFSMIGLGGGVLYVPILLAGGLTAHSAVAISLAIMLIMSLTAAFIYHTNSLVEWKLLLLMEPFSIAGALAGSYFSVILPERAIFILFAVAMITAASMSIFSPEKKLSSIKPKNNYPGLVKINRNGEHFAVNMWISSPASFLAGLISSLVGIGGGFLKVPLMTTVFNVPIKIAVATSSAMIVITSFSGFAGHIAEGHVDYKLAAVVGALAFAGAVIGAKISVKSDKKFLKKLLISLQIGAAVWMIYKAFN